MTSDEKHPIAAGLVALIAVGLAVGLMLGIFTVVFTHVAGLGDDDGPNATDGGPSLYLPSPEPTDTTTGSAAAASSPAAAPPASSAPAAQITLQSGAASVGPMERIDLSGVYPAGEGAVLQVQRKGDGSGWENFPVTAAVTGGTFSTYVQTGRAGVQRFRVRDSDSGVVSNVVSVTVG
ncbi:hypothetical protein SAMN04487968_102204 [Nocardioides terrae]|uniref:Uncharacterized protein n=1 Tax=Nocardioides terrae TaxID=574651 RepID=A0A1I1EXY2_9ACTN|nr:hypothetical protein [Nocardioides terrae]SFB89763.1 hypothetical protein SAMN04487968_102204 [Nocardioides terrae]